MSWGFRNKYVEFLFIFVDYCKMLSSAANLVLVKLEIFLLQRIEIFFVDQCIVRLIFMTCCVLYVSVVS